MVKKFLSQRGIQYREKDVSRDQAAATEMVRQSGQQGVPVTVIGGDVILGFNRPRLEQVVARASRPRPRFGAKVAGAEAIARKQGISLPAGAYIGGVRPDTPAARAGLQEGDVVISLNGKTIRGSKDLQRALSSVSIGEPLEIVWWRNGREVFGQLEL
jgi:S1-C subfamily serine protease